MFTNLFAHHCFLHLTPFFLDLPKSISFTSSFSKDLFLINSLSPYRPKEMEWVKWVWNSILTVIFSHCFEDIMLSSGLFFWGGGRDRNMLSVKLSFIYNTFLKISHYCYIKIHVGVLRSQQNSFWCVFIFILFKFIVLSEFEKSCFLSILGNPGPLSSLKNVLSLFLCDRTAN